MSFNFLDKLSIELPDSNLQDLYYSFTQLQSQLRQPMSDSEVLKILNLYIQSGETEKLSKALVCGSLSGLDWSKYLFIGSQDLLVSACTALQSLLPVIKSRAFALNLFTKLWKSSIPGFSDLFLSFLRTFEFPSELKSELDWILSSQFVSLIFYKVLKLASLACVDGNPSLSDYTYLILYLWRHKREHCLSIGRDLMRIIPSLAETAGIESVWNDLFTQNRDSSHLYWLILCTPTQLKFHSVLLSPSLEAKIVYVIENSTGINYTRYLKWIIEEFGEFMIPDIVRFIVCYPGNKEATPRWQIICWLLGCSSDRQIQANAKQALIFDALFFNQADQIYTIEPLMSILKHSLAKTPHITEEILEFLLTSAELYDRRSIAGMMRSLRECFSIAYYNRLSPSLDTFMNDDRIDPSIKAKLSELVDSSCNSESSHDEETPPNTPRSFESYGEIGNDFTNEPSFDKFIQILEKNPINKDLAHYILRSLPHELSSPILMEIPKNSVIHQMFSKAENDEKIAAFVEIAMGIESLLAIRVLIYSLHNKSNLYFKIENNLEKDLRVCTDEVSLETLNWIFPQLLIKQKITPAILMFFLANATHEVLLLAEFNLYSSTYKLISPYLVETLQLAANLSVIEKNCLWRLITAEIPTSCLSTLIEYCASEYSPENWSGLLDYFQVHCSEIQSSHVHSLLTLPFHLCSVVAALIKTLNPCTVMKN